jgi:hypothetical protein
MEINGRCAAVARTRDVCAEGVRSSSLTAAKRRAAALHETIGHLLVATAARTSGRLKLTWPKLSAATLNPLTNAIPLLLGILACFAVCTTSGIVALSIIVVLPTSFRLWVTEIDLPLPSTLPVTPDQELPMYTV